MNPEPNPYLPPSSQPWKDFGGGVNRLYAISRLKPPVITLLVVNCVMMVFIIVAMGINVLGIGLGVAEGEEDAAIVLLQGTVGIATSLFGLLLGVIVILGCIQMLKLESYPLGIAACICSMIPCISPCCITGIPVALWTLVVLNDPLVKAAFRR